MQSIPENLRNIHSVFNAVLHNDIKLMPMTYNYQYGILFKGPNLYPFFKDKEYLSFQKVTENGAKIIHFTAIKPWNQIIGKESINWWKLARETDFYEMISMRPPPSKKTKIT